MANLKSSSQYHPEIEHRQTLNYLHVTRAFYIARERFVRDEILIHPLRRPLAIPIHMFIALGNHLSVVKIMGLHGH